jgi:hypothetical protein
LSNNPFNVQKNRKDVLEQVSKSCNFRTTFEKGELLSGRSIASSLRNSQQDRSLFGESTSNKQQQLLLESTGLFNDSTTPLAMHRQLKMQKRAQQKLLYIEPEEPEEDAGGAFTANPADDIPRNKLTEKLARGIQSFV